MRDRLTLHVQRAFGAIAVGALLWAWAGWVEAAELAGRLVAASGPVEIRALGQSVWRVATLRAGLQPGDMVRVGPGGTAEVAFVYGVIRLGENTVVALPPPQALPVGAGTPDSVRLLLNGGRALFRILKEGLGGSFEVITPSIVVGVKGTTFGVEQGPNIGVVVFEGTVEVAQVGRPALPPLTLGAGQFTVLVQGQLTVPRLFQPGQPGPLWNGAPVTLTSAPLPAPPHGPAAPSNPAAASVPLASGSGLASPEGQGDDARRSEIVPLALSSPAAAGPSLSQSSGPPDVSHPSGPPGLTGTAPGLSQSSGPPGLVGTAPGLSQGGAWVGLSAGGPPGLAGAWRPSLSGVGPALPVGGPKGQGKK